MNRKPGQCILLLSLILVTGLINCGEHANIEQENMKIEAEALTAALRQFELSPDNFHLFLRAFKAEEELELWVKGIENHQWRFFKIYPFCKSSGSLGPKRKEGDRQIPEGVYHIDRFNPRSKFYLSLGLNYPNASDRILGDPEMPGSDIFIHGGCETIGCIPITNVGIEAVYQFASWAKNNGQTKIPVHIYPFRFREDNWQKYSAVYPEVVEFWQQLEVIYRVFEDRKELPDVGITAGGHYRLSGR